DQRLVLRDDDGAQTRGQSKKIALNSLSVGCGIVVSLVDSLFRGHQPRRRKRRANQPLIMCAGEAARKLRKVGEQTHRGRGRVNDSRLIGLDRALHPFRIGGMRVEQARLATEGLRKVTALNFRGDLIRAADYEFRQLIEELLLSLP